MNRNSDNSQHNSVIFINNYLRKQYYYDICFPYNLVRYYLEKRQTAKAAKHEMVSCFDYKTK